MLLSEESIKYNMQARVDKLREIHDRISDKKKEIYEKREKNNKEIISRSFTKHVEHQEIAVF